MKTIGFIGCGNMGGALLRATLKALSPDCVFVADSDENKTAAFKKEYGVTVTTAEGIAKSCDAIVLGVKPQVLFALLSSLSPALEQREEKPLLISMAAGISLKSIKEAVGSLPLIRIMPNTPASVGEGMILWAEDGASEEHTAFFTTAFSLAGKLDKLDEKFIDAASALSGCGPAFVSLFAEALADGAVACGLPRQNASLYAAQTLLGTAKLILESGEHPGKLKDAVCSPGGTTIEGVRALEEGALRGTVMDAVVAAYEKTLALGKK